MVKNILKWQGGKSSLLYGVLKNEMPAELFDPNADITFIDAFTGGGSVWLYVLQNCPGVKRLLINDYNFRLVELYYAIKNNIEDLITLTKALQDAYDKEINKSDFYYKVRDKFNSFDIWSMEFGYVERAAILLFLNRTAFNGIYRENPNHKFNVPWCKKESVTVLYEDELREANRLLNKPEVEIQFCRGDFSYIESYVTKGNTFIYFDPPYRPLTGSGSFTDYTTSNFNDKDQERLKSLSDYLWKTFKAKIMISNSYDPKDDFIIKLYDNYKVRQINATRSSGGKGAMRGGILENLITNY